MFWRKMNANAIFNAAIEQLWITVFSMKFSNKVIWKRVLKKNGWSWSNKQNYRKLTKRKGRLYKRHPPEIIKLLEKYCFRKQNWEWKEALDESCAFKNFFGSQGCCKERGKNRRDNFLFKNAVPTAQSDVPNQEDFTFETISARLKHFSRSKSKVENTALKNKVLLGVGRQQQRKYLGDRRIEEQICLVDLKTERRVSVVWKSKQYIIIKIFTSWWKLLQNLWTAE